MITGKQAYSHRADLHHKRFWQCPKCFNFVGVHNKGEGRKPLGCIPNKEMKKIRMQIHAMIDPIWQTKQKTRSEVYKAISEKIGYEYHTAELRDLSEAKKIYEAVKELL